MGGGKAFKILLYVAELGQNFPKVQSKVIISLIAGRFSSKPLEQVRQIFMLIAITRKFIAQKLRKASLSS